MSRFPALSVIALLILGCATLAPVPTATAVPSPTSTATPKPTATPRPTRTEPAPTQTHLSLIEMVPEGQPVTEWKGIPIMPSATRGGGDEKGYTFLVEATRTEITSFYNDRLSRLGWESFAQGEGETGAVMLFFQKGSEMLILSIFDSGGQGMIVMIVK